VIVDLARPCPISTKVAMVVVVVAGGGGGGVHMGDGRDGWMDGWMDGRWNGRPDAGRN